MKLFNTKNLRNDNTGVAAIEFAIILPFLLLVLYGTYTVANGILISRKVDNAVNDLGFIVSREPRIATGNLDTVTGGCRAEGCTGGATRLNAIIDNIFPMLLYPNNANTKYAAMVSYVGIPISPSGAPNTIRMMWSHQRGAVGASTTNVNAQLGLESMCAPYQSTTNVNGVVTPTSTYKEKYLANTTATDRATAIFPGQSFIVSSVRFQTDGFGAPIVHSGNIPSGQSLFDNQNFLRHSTYAVRSSWQDVDNDGFVDSGEFFNEMHYCTDCTTPSHTLNQPIGALGNEATLCSATEAQKLRMRCVTTLPLATTATNYNSSGCSFK